MIPINVSDLEKEEVELEDIIQRLSTNITLLERCNKEWTTLLNELKDDAKLKEEKEYLWTTDGDDEIIELLLDSNETVACLQGRLAQARKKCANLTSKGNGIFNKSRVERKGYFTN